MEGGMIGSKVTFRHNGDVVIDAVVQGKWWRQADGFFYKSDTGYQLCSKKKPRLRDKILSKLGDEQSP
jgi:hypothetical protein